MIVEEGLARIDVCEGVFYNPHMKLSRDISVAVLRAVGRPLRILDAFTATGIRGIRYALEAGLNPTFLDLKEEAVECCKKNVSKNGLEAKVFREDFNKHRGSYEGIELDPFGSPAPYVDHAAELMEEEGLLSVTATDAMMLCGIQKEATERFYGSKPLHNSFCHETGLRILMKRVAEALLKKGKGMKPLCSFYYRHQFKTIVLASEAYVEETEQSITELTWRGKRYGPVWAGRLHDKRLLAKAEAPSKAAAKYLNRFLEELDAVPFFYSLPALCSEARTTPPKLSAVLEALEKKGYRATRTHFAGDAFKTDAPEEAVKEIVGLAAGWGSD